MKNTTLNYCDLIKAYYEGLHTKLRNFSVGPDFLETWVHDENHSRSVLGILEAALQAKIDMLTVQIGEEFADEIDVDWIQKKLGREAKLSTEKTVAGGIDLRLQTTISEVAKEPIAPCYKTALERAEKLLLLERAIDPSAKNYYFAEHEGILLALEMAENTIISAAYHSGAHGFTRALLDQFCQLIQRQPIQEAAEHGVIRLEAKLRDPLLPAPVPGLITTENAGAIFSIPLSLVRAIYSRYRNEKNKKMEWNTWELPISNRWKSMPESDRTQEARQILAAILKETPELDIGTEIIGIQNETRVLLAPPKSEDSWLVGHKLMRIEKLMRSRLEPRIELLLENAEDRNRREERTSRGTEQGSAR